MDETNTLALALLKANLGYFDSQLEPAVEDYLKSRLQVAETELRETCGIRLNRGEVASEDLVATYAAWLYRKRVTGESKGPMLMSMIRSWQTRQAMQEETA